jgi:L-threonylcarbamoyladenylate synthase
MTDRITTAVAALRKGGLVAFPTETVFGLGADAAHSRAVRRVFEVKRRPVSHPLIVHVADRAELGRVGTQLSTDALRLAEALWPGPLTLVVRDAGVVAREVTGGQPTVAVRVPSHPVALQLLREFGSGIAAPSANRFTHVSATRAEHVEAELGNEVDVILDGECSVGVESTIVDCTTEDPCVLRPGGVTLEALEAVLRKPVPWHRASHVRVPGQHVHHYAPRARVELFDVPELVARLAHTDGCRVALLIDPESELLLPRLSSAALPANFVVLPTGATLEEYAARLYELFRVADQQGCREIWATTPSVVGIGLAIVDRLQRAAS